MQRFTTKKLAGVSNDVLDDLVNGKEGVAILHMPALQVLQIDGNLVWML